MLVGDVLDGSYIVASSLRPHACSNSYTHADTHGNANANAEPTAYRHANSGKTEVWRGV